MTEKIVRQYNDIRADLRTDDSIFNAEPDKVRRVKDIVLYRLDPVDRAILLLYADCGSLRDLGKRLGVSHSSVRTIVNGIKDKVLALYYEQTARELKENIHTKI